MPGYYEKMKDEARKRLKMPHMSLFIWLRSKTIVRSFRVIKVATTETVLGALMLDKDYVQGLGCSLSHHLSSFPVSAIQGCKEPEDTMQFQDDELSYALGKQASLSTFNDQSCRIIGPIGS